MSGGGREPAGRPDLFLLESAIRVAWDCLNEGEEQRLRDWIEAHPDYGPIARALEMAKEQAA